MFDPEPTAPGVRPLRAASIPSWLVSVLVCAVLAAPAAASQRAAVDRGPPYRVERFAAGIPIPRPPSWIADAVDRAIIGNSLADAVRPVIPGLPDEFGPATQEDDEVERWRVAMATIAAGVGGFFAGLYIGAATNSYEALYAAPVTSILASTTTAHLVSGRRGDLALSIGISTAVTALLAAGGGELWIVAGPAAAIPISVHMETR